MARYGVLGDIHGNKEALLAALGALAEQDIHGTLCVGDIVGYNADPDECAAIVRERGIKTIAGNHDLIGTGRLGFERCSNNARYALKRTRRRLAPQTASWLQTLPERLLVHRYIALVHGGVRDIQQYMTTPEHIRQNAAFLREDFPAARVCFFGHSHEQRIYEVDGDDVQDVTESFSAFSPGKLYFINPGSVDASRKSRHKLAECAVLDTSAGTVEFLRVPYDAAATEAKAHIYGYRIGPIRDRLYSLRRRVMKTLTSARSSGV
jgi:predicted phosphodiesterase